MKTITLTIPTSWKEWRQYIKEKKSARRQHNVKVLWNFVLEIEREVNDNHWADHITCEMKKHVFTSIFHHAKIVMLYNKARKELK